MALATTSLRSALRCVIIAYGMPAGWPRRLGIEIMCHLRLFSRFAPFVRVSGLQRLRAAEVLKRPVGLKYRECVSGMWRWTTEEGAAPYVQSGACAMPEGTAGFKDGRNGTRRKTRATTARSRAGRACRTAARGTGRRRRHKWHKWRKWHINLIPRRRAS